MYINFTELNLVGQVIEEAKLFIAKGKACRALEEEKPIKNARQLLGSFKKSNNEARAQADSRIGFEWMMHRMSRLTNQSIWQILLNKKL